MYDSNFFLNIQEHALENKTKKTLYGTTVETEELFVPRTGPAETSREWCLVHVDTFPPAYRVTSPTWTPRPFEPSHPIADIPQFHSLTRISSPNASSVNALSLLHTRSDPYKPHSHSRFSIPFTAIKFLHLPIANRE